MTLIYIDIVMFSLIISRLSVKLTFFSTDWQGLHGLTIEEYNCICLCMFGLLCESVASPTCESWDTVVRKQSSRHSQHSLCQLLNSVVANVGTVP